MNEPTVSELVQLAAPKRELNPTMQAAVEDAVKALMSAWHKHVITAAEVAEKLHEYAVKVASELE